MNENLIKMLRCLASNTADGDCYMDFYNMHDENIVRMHCGNYFKDEICCPYYQKEFETCFIDGECSEGLAKAADLLEQLQKEKAERDNPQPLTLQELENLLEQPIWIDTGEILFSEQIVGHHDILERITEKQVKIFWFTSSASGFFAEDYGKTWLAYKYRPKEEN